MANTRTRRSKSDYVAGQLTNRNYIPFGNFDSVELGTGYINYFQDAAASRPVDGTGGSPAGLTVTRTVTNPLTGASSLLISKDAVNRQGQGFSVDYAIDRKDRASQLLVKMNYELASGTFQNGTTTLDSDLIVYMYDVTNGTLIEPSTFKIDSAVSGITTQFQATFQTASNSTSYRLIFYVPTTNATAWTMSVDELFLGNAGRSTGVQAKAPTIQKFTSGSGTYTTPAGVSHIRVRMVGGGAGGTGSGTAVNTGTNGGTTTFGTSLLVANGGQGSGAGSIGGVGGTASLGTGPVGTALTGGTGGTSSYTRSAQDIGGGSGASTPFGAGGNGTMQGIGGNPAPANTGAGGGGGGMTNVSAVYGGGGGGAGGFIDAIISGSTLASTFAWAVGTGGAGGAAGTSGFAGTAGGSGYIEVTEFYYGNNVLISDQAASRVVAMAANTSTTAATTSAPFIFTSVSNDTHGAYNSSTGVYTVRVPGAYLVNTTVYTGASSQALTIYINGVYTTQGLVNQASNAPAMVTDLYFLKVGDTIEVRPTSPVTASGGASLNRFSVMMVQGPAQIQAATVVAVDADSPTSTHTASAADLTGWTTRVDTTNSFNASTGVFTAPGPGFYKFDASYAPANTATPCSIQVFKNGSAYNSRRGQSYSNGAVFPVAQVHGIIQLNTGETLKFLAGNSSGSAVATDGTSTNLQIFRVSGIN